MSQQPPASASSRRELIAIAAAAAAVPARLVAAPLRFFTAAEFAAVDELCELIIPADEQSGGAKAARVAEYIDRLLAEAWEQQDRDAFRAGLRPYVSIGKAEREAMLREAAKGEKDPSTPVAKFFVLLKKHTVRGYYTSSVGIHDDLGYKGNVLQQRDYAGELP